MSRRTRNLELRFCDLHRTRRKDTLINHIAKSLFICLILVVIWLWNY